MKQQMNRIASFIESIHVEPDIDKCESTLLSVNMESLGGDNGGNCTNDLYKQCQNAKNGGDCANYSSACPDSKNSGTCLNTKVDRPSSGNYMRTQS